MTAFMVGLASVLAATMTMTIGQASTTGASKPVLTAQQRALPAGFIAI
jgi:hypothetical protein